MHKVLAAILVWNVMSVSIAPVHAMNAGRAVQVRHEPTATVEKLGVMAFGALSGMAVWVGGIYIYRNVNFQMPGTILGPFLVVLGLYGVVSAMRRLNKINQHEQ